MSIELRNQIRALEQRIEKLEAERPALRRAYLDVANGLERHERKIDGLVGQGGFTAERERISMPFPRCLKELGYPGPKETP